MQLTSLMAYEDQKNTTQHHYKLLVLSEILKHNYITDRQISENLNIKINVVTGRRNELMHDGYVVLYKKVKCQYTGKTVIAWTINLNKFFVVLRMLNIEYKGVRKC